jgi:multidrug efflux pump subunit AcrA (membrane-fusion protein)
MLGGGMDLSSLFGGASMGDLSSLAGLSSLEDLSGGFDVGSLLGSSSASSAAAAYAKAEAFSIGEEIKVDVVIAVTELDILQITAGQDATVTMDAIPGRSFEGQVKSIARSGSNTGGATKYDVTVELPYDPDMRVDMSCMVNILVGEADQVRVIPSAAVLTEQGKNYVYTSCTEEGVLGDKVEVETGLADGEYVEIKEGLEEGQRIYYRNKTMNLLETRMENMGSYYGQTENVSGV